MGDDMTKRENERLIRLEAVLDIYGGNSDRWPAGEREALIGLAQSDPEAGRLLAEARALDRVMAHAPDGKASAALASRIVAAAVADESREARVVPIGAARARRNDPVRIGRRTVVGPAAALMAASFAVGLYLGVAGLGDVALDTAFGAETETSASDDLDELFGTTDTMSEEDLL